MAIAAPAPRSGVDRIEDAVSIKEASALFAQTGFPVPESTLRRWAKEENLHSVRGQYSDSDLLELHARRMFG